MRIVGGTWRGKRLTVPEGRDTRPTLDRVRETVFNMLDHNPNLVREDGISAVRDAVVLDAFAGSGALGLEALSRGAASAVFMETNRPAQRALQENLAALKPRKAQLITGSAVKPARAATAATLVLLDPPYGEGLVEAALAALIPTGWVAPDALIYVEHGARETIDIEAHAELLLSRKVGKSIIAFYRARSR